MCRVAMGGGAESVHKYGMYIFVDSSHHIKSCTLLTLFYITSFS